MKFQKRNPVVRGVAHIRGGTISIMDLRQATGHAPLDDIQNCFVIITEYNRTTQGFSCASRRSYCEYETGVIFIHHLREQGKNTT